MTNSNETNYSILTKDLNSLNTLELDLAFDNGFGFIKALGSAGIFLKHARFRKVEIADSIDTKNENGIQVEIDGDVYILADSEVGADSEDDYFDKLTSISTTLFCIAAIAHLSNNAKNVSVNIMTGIPASQYADPAHREEMKATLMKINSFKSIKINGVEKNIKIINCYVSRQGAINGILQTLNFRKNVAVLDIGTVTVNKNEFEDCKITKSVSTRQGISNFYTMLHNKLENISFKDEHDKRFTIHYKDTHELMNHVTKGYLVGRGREYRLDDGNVVAELFKKIVHEYAVGIVKSFGKKEDFSMFNTVVLSGGGALPAIREELKTIIENDNVVIVDKIDGIHIDQDKTISQFLNAINYYMLLNAKMATVR